MKRLNSALIFLIPLILIVLFYFFLPLIYMLFSSFMSNKSVSFENYMSIFTSKFLLLSFWNSIKLSFLSAIVALIAALLGVYAIYSYSETVRERILVIINLTSNFSGVPLAFAFIILLGNSGFITIIMNKMNWNFDFSIYSWSGLVLIYIYFQLPLAIMLLYPIYYGIQQNLKDAATLLKATPFVFWRKIGIPIILPSVAGTFAILFANAMGAYASAYALTGSSYNLAAIRIGNLLSGDIFANPELASAIAVVLGSIMVTSMLLSEWLTKRARKDLIRK
ncbi:ABC transporter permease subunit [Solibacillus sp. FSL H8-0523]|uniref:ABC transporter permease n=1 Tax=Solibacillus sp. FSL H8-0523 TaxID=2954511 RepID=UPI0031015C51